MLPQYVPMTAPQFAQHTALIWLAAIAFAFLSQRPERAQSYLQAFPLELSCTFGAQLSVINMAASRSYSSGVWRIRRKLVPKLAQQCPVLSYTSGVLAELWPSLKQHWPSCAQLSLIFDLPTHCSIVVCHSPKRLTCTCALTQLLLASPW